MNRLIMLSATSVAGLAFAALAQAAPGGPIGTMQVGDYICETPGDATGPAGVRASDQDFAVVNASYYTNARGRGSYLLTGDLLVMTSGPKQGQRFRRLGGGFLREIDKAGNPQSLRCIRRVNNNR